LWFYYLNFLLFGLFFLMLVLKPDFLNAFLLFYLLRSDTCLSFWPHHRFLESASQTLFRTGFANCFGIFFRPVMLVGECI
jgi:hypothetical protein